MTTTSTVDIWVRREPGSYASIGKLVIGCCSKHGHQVARIDAIEPRPLRSKDLGPMFKATLSMLCCGMERDQFMFDDQEYSFYQSGIR